MFKKNKNCLVTEGGDYVYLPGGKMLDFESNDAYAIIIMDNVLFYHKQGGNSHWEILNSLRLFKSYYPQTKLDHFKIGAVTSLTESELYAFIEKNYDEMTNLRKTRHCRFWSKNNILASWNSSSDFKSLDIRLLKEFIIELGNKFKKTKVLPAELDSINQDENFTTEDFYSWDEFVNHTKNSNYFDDQELELKRKAHLLGANVAGVNKNAVKRKENPFADYYVRNESTIMESPDHVNYKDEDAFWDSTGNVTFIINKYGDTVYAYKSYITHAMISLALTYMSYKKIPYELKNYFKEDHIIHIIDNNYLHFIGDRNRIMSDLGNFTTLNDGPRQRLNELALGRLFSKVPVVSFWNDRNNLNVEQINGTIRLIETAQIDPKLLEYEVEDDIKISFNIFKNLNSNNKKRKIEFSSGLSPEEALHLSPEPMIKNQLKKEKGIRPKYPIPLDLKQKAYAESTHKYYSFDWDDNLLYMPSKILMETVSGDKIELSTSEYRDFKDNLENGILYEKNGQIIKGSFDGSYYQFREDFDKEFLKQIFKAEMGPAWPDFRDAVNNGRIFSIITARGHAPETLIEAIKLLIESEFGGLSKTRCIDSLKEIHYFSESTKELNDTDLFERYLKSLCKYYPVSYKNENNKDVPGSKEKFLLEFRSYVHSAFSGMSEEFKNKVSNNFVIDFSDDDLGNINRLKNNILHEDIVIKSTNSGKIEEIVR